MATVSEEDMANWLQTIAENLSTLQTAMANVQTAIQAMHADMGNNDDTAESDPDNNATVVAALKGIQQQNETMITALNNTITAVNTVNSTLNAGINVSIL